jgi:hypothetical protein
MRGVDTSKKGQGGDWGRIRHLRHRVVIHLTNNKKRAGCGVGDSLELNLITTFPCLHKNVSGAGTNSARTLKYYV